MLEKDDPNRTTLLWAAAFLVVSWVLACLIGPPFVIEDNSQSLEVADLRSSSVWGTGLIVTVTNSTAKEVTALRLPCEDEVIFLPGQTRSFEVTSQGSIAECDPEGKPSGDEISFRFSEGFFR